MAVFKTSLTKAKMGPLDTIEGRDLSHVLTGSTATQLLGNPSVKVIKIENRTTIGNPLKIFKALVTYRHAPTRFGQHTSVVLALSSQQKTNYCETNRQ